MGLMNLSINSKKPIGFGILTCNNLKQAIDRSKPNKKPVPKANPRTKRANRSMIVTSRKK